jgi:hypothetical protein
MLFKLMPALLKCDLVPIVPNAILHVLLTINLVVFLSSIWVPFLARFGPFSPTMKPGRMDISSFWTHRDWTRETHF